MLRGKKTFWISSLGQIVQFDTIKYVDLLRTILVSSCGLKKRVTKIAAFHLMKRRLKMSECFTRNGYLKFRNSNSFGFVSRKNSKLNQTKLCIVIVSLVGLSTLPTLSKFGIKSLEESRIENGTFCIFSRIVSGEESEMFHEKTLLFSLIFRWCRRLPPVMAL